MSALTNLTANANKVRFTSLFPSDKIAYEGTFSSSQGAASSSTYSLPNPYGQAAFITLAWSIDDTNYYPMQAYSTILAPYTANAWVDSTTIYIYLENNSGGAVTIYTKFALDSIT